MTLRHLRRVVLVSAAAVAAVITIPGPVALAQQTVPASYGELDDVSCPVSDFCMAVGDLAAPDPALAYTWDGRRWTLVPTANLINGWPWTNLTSVSCTSSTRCIATGYAWGGHQTVLIAERWTGSAWRYMTIQRPGKGSVGKIDCVSAGWCMAVGSRTVKLPDGTTTSAPAAWLLRNGKLVLIPVVRAYQSMRLWSVSCVSRTICTAVGSATPAGRPVIEHWNGAAWHEVIPEPYPVPGQTFRGDSYLSDISCPELGDCVAVGRPTETSLSPDMLVVQHRGGGPWQVRNPSTPSKFIIYSPSVSCLSFYVCGAVMREPDEQVILPLLAWRDRRTKHWAFHYFFPDWLYGASCAGRVCTYVGTKMSDDFGTAEPVIYRGRGLNPVKQTIPLPG